MFLSTDLQTNIRQAHVYLPFHKSFDLTERNLILGQTPAYYFCINGFFQNALLQHLFSDLMNPMFTQHPLIENLHHYVQSRIGYAQAELTSDWDRILRAVLSGVTALMVEGFDQALLIDTRSYPARGIEEPENEKLTRGAKDGFVETLLMNTALIRRRIRSRRMTFELHSVGSESKTDVAIAYVDTLHDKKLLMRIRKRLEELDVTSLTMGVKSMEELIVKKRWFNPLPNVLLTERPDVACSYLMEGHILLIVDNSPYVCVLPCTLFQFTQSPEDYNKSPVVGTYQRLVRFLCIPVSFLLLPLFLLTSQLSTGGSIFSNNHGEANLFLYVLIVEFILELFKTSSSLASGRLAGSLSIVGGLILSDVAIKLNWASPEAIFYGAVTMLATLSLSNREFGEALRMYRLFLILCTGIGGYWGFTIGLLLVLLSVVTTPTFGKKSYFWPLFPFQASALKTLIFRFPTYMAQPGDSIRKHKK